MGIVEVDVGGTHLFKVQRDTLCKVQNSKLAQLFFNKQLLFQTTDGRVFIDRNGEIFSLVLDYLRNDGRMGDIEDKYILS